MVEQARVLVSERQNIGITAVAGSGQEVKPKLRCFWCGGNHMIWFCNRKQQGVSDQAWSDTASDRKYSGSIEYWKCGGKGHLSRNCQAGNEKGKPSVPVDFPATHMKALPSVEVIVGNIIVRALVDSGCSQTIASKSLIKNFVPCRGEVVTVDGNRVKCCGTGDLSMVVSNQQLEIKALVLDKLLPQYQIVLGIDIISRLNGVWIDGTGQGIVRFGMSNVAVSPRLQIYDKDFAAMFDGEKWTMEWKWIDTAPTLQNRTVCYSIPVSAKEVFDVELQLWIDEGVLVPVPQEERVDSVVPLMAVEQSTKGKTWLGLRFSRIKSICFKPFRC